MKICPNCGTPMEDHFTFCPSCGTSQPAAPAEQPSPFAPREYTPMPEGGHYYVSTGGGDNKKKLITIIAAVAAAIVLIVVLCCTVFSADAAAKRTVKAYFKACNDRNASKIVSLVYPKPVLEYREDEYDEDKDDIIDGIEDMFEFSDDTYGDDWKIKDIKITKVKDMKDDDFEELQEFYEDKYDMKITDAKIVKVDSTIEGEDDDEDFKNSEFIVYKYKGNWYMTN